MDRGVTLVMEGPWVSVITPVFNRRNEIAGCITSVRAQSYEKVEHLIVDGGSRDGTLEQIRKMAYSRLVLISGKDKGVYDAMNIGVRRARGDVLLFLGADDRLVDEWVLQDVFTALDWDRYDLLYGDVLYDDGEFFPSRFDWLIVLRNTLHHQGVFYHRRVFDRWMYNPARRILGDYELNLLLWLSRFSALRLNRVISRCGKAGLSKMCRWSHYVEELRIKREVLRGGARLFGMAVVPFKYMAKVGVRMLLDRRL